jgi:hypothetical protein
MNPVIVDILLVIQWWLSWKPFQPLVLLREYCRKIFFKKQNISYGTKKKVHHMAQRMRWVLDGNRSLRVALR